MSRVSSSAMIFAAVACLAAALPAALLSRKQETGGVAPYLEYEVKPLSATALQRTPQEALRAGD